LSSLRQWEEEVSTLVWVCKKTEEEDKRAKEEKIKAKRPVAVKKETRGWWSGDPKVRGLNDRHQTRKRIP